MRFVHRTAGILRDQFAGGRVGEVARLFTLSGVVNSYADNLVVRAADGGPIPRARLSSYYPHWEVPLWETTDWDEPPGERRVAALLSATLND